MLSVFRPAGSLNAGYGNEFVNGCLSILLENGISTPDQLLTRLQVEKASFHNEDKIKIIKDGQSSKATYYSHIHTLFSLYTLSLKQQDIMRNMCFLPSTDISARIFAKWLELPTLNEINDLIETGFVQPVPLRISMCASLKPAFLNLFFNVFM